MRDGFNERRPPPHRPQDDDLPFAKKLAFTGILLSASLILALVLIEILVRVTLDIYECDDRLGWTFEKGGSGLKISRAREFMQLHSFDSNGLRDTGEAPTDGQNSFRVLLLGDSFSAGLQVSKDDLFSTRLEKSMSAALGGDRRFKTLNAGIDGYGTTEELLLFERLARQREWDAVILQVSTGNDVADNWPYAGSWIHWIAVKCGRPFFRPGEHELVPTNEGAPVRRPMSPLHRFLSNFAIYSLLVPFPPEPEYAHPDFSVENMWQDTHRAKMERAWAHFNNILLQFATAVRRKGIPLIVVLLPNKEDTGQGRPDENRLYHHASLRSLLSANEVDYIDLLPVFREESHNGKDPLYFNTDVHLNERGHRVVARTLQEWFDRRCRPLRSDLKACLKGSATLVQPRRWRP